MSTPPNDLDLDLDEISAALAAQCQMDYDSTGPKAPHGDIVYKGVTLSSQYDVASEFADMKRTIDLMPELMARRLEAIWCDSNACAYYSVSIKPGKFLPDLPHAIERAFQGMGGFNGLCIECPGQKIPFIDCYWPGEWDNEIG